MTIKKYYVVWVGRYAGIFESWEDCNEQIFSYPKAVYKSFKSKELAEKAFNSSSKEFIGQDVFETEFLEEQLKKIGDPIKDSISVDGAWNTSTEINTFLSDWDTYNSTDLVNMGIDYDIWLQTNYSLPPWPSIANLTDVQALVGSQSTSTFATFLAQATTYHTSTTYLFSFMSSSDFIQQLGSIGSLTTTVIQVQFTPTEIFTALAQAGLATLWGNIQDEEIAVTGDDHLILEYYETNFPSEYVHQCIIVLPSFIDSYISQSVSDYLQLIKANYTREQYANLMAALTELYYIPTQTLQLAEWHIYGSSRVGVYKANKSLAVVEDEVITEVEYQTRVKFRYNGKKQYELSNHLGNVLVTISDRRKAICNEADSTLRYEAVVVTANDYYSFGSPLIGRTYQAGSLNGYRFGFNGKEKDDEINVDGGSYDFGARIYDGRLGRWMSVDPAKKNFPFESHFCFVSNSPFIYVDKEGKSKWIVYREINESTGVITEIKYLKDSKILKAVSTTVSDGLGGSSPRVNYYDINVVHTVRITKEGKMIDQGVKTERGDFRVWTTFQSNFWANVIKTENEEEEKFENEGLVGIRFTTSEEGSYGQGNSHNSSRKYLRSENIDLLLGAINATILGAKGGKALTKPVKSLHDLVDKLGTSTALVETLKGIKDAFGKKEYKCSNCNEKVDSAGHNGLPAKEVKKTDK